MLIHKDDELFGFEDEDILRLSVTAPSATPESISEVNVELNELKNVVVLEMKLDETFFEMLVGK